MATKDKASSKGGLANSWGHVRKRPLPTAVTGFEFEEIDGIKVPKAPSNDTATVIRNDGPALAWELTQAMAFAQGYAEKKGHVVSPGALLDKFPLIAKYCGVDGAQEIACSDAGKISSRQVAVNAISKLTQVKSSTVERYFRESSTVKKK